MQTATISQVRQTLVERFGADALVFDRDGRGQGGGFDVSKTIGAGFDGSHVRVYDEGIHVAAYAFAPGRRSPQVVELTDAGELATWIADRI